MSIPEGGKLFLQHFVEAAVQESVKQEGLEKYRQRVEKLKRMPEYIIAILSFPFLVLLVIFGVLLKTLKYTVTLFSIVLTLFMTMMIVHTTEIAVYEHRHFAVCSTTLFDETVPFTLHFLTDFMCDVWDLYFLFFHNRVRDLDATKRRVEYIRAVRSQEELQSEKKAKQCFECKSSGGGGDGHPGPPGISDGHPGLPGVCLEAK